MLVPNKMLFELLVFPDDEHLKAFCTKVKEIWKIDGVTKEHKIEVENLAFLTKLFSHSKEISDVLAKAGAELKTIIEG